MPKPEDKGNQGKKDNAPGLQSEREVYDAAGNPVDPAMTQQDWKDRDKDAGLTRDDGAEDTDAGADVPTGEDQPA